LASQQLIDIIIKAQDQASATAEKVHQSLNKIGNTVGGFVNKVPVLSSLSAKFGNIGSTIRAKFEPALTRARQKLESLSNGAKGFGSMLGPLKGALSMTVGMIGYDLVNGLISAARASINANSQLDYFGKRLNMTGAETTKFRSEIDSLQKEFRKVDMTAVGATAEEMAVKFNLPKKSIGDLTRMTAVLSSTFVKEGRTQEDAILAVSDALDGQFKRLQEIGITQDTLKANGWNGNLEDQDSLIKALNKSMSEMGYEQTAKDITNLDEAWGALTIAGGQLLQKVLVPITPVIIQMVDAFLKVADAIGPIIEGFVNFISNMPDWAQLAGLLIAFGAAINYVSIMIWDDLIASLAAATLAAWDFAAAMLANPLTWVALALIAIAVAIYEVGKAFGWWTDVNSMLSAIWAGLNRLWSAFINHPDVQGFISAMIPVWNALSGAVGRVVSWVGSFFNKASGSKFDAVRGFIEVVGVAWKAMTLPIRLVINTIVALYNYIRSLPGKIRSALSSIASILTAPFRSGYNRIKGVIDTIKSVTNGLSGGISIGSITSKLTQPFTNAYNKIIGIVDSIKAKANSIPVIGGYFGFDFEELAKANSKSTLDINLNVDLKNVPAGTDTETLIAVLTDKSVLQALTGNSDFQYYDNKAKSRLLARNNRARGA